MHIKSFGTEEDSFISNIGTLTSSSSTFLEGEDGI
jgi:hypothetical protein